MTTAHPTGPPGENSLLSTENNANHQRVSPVASSTPEGSVLRTPRPLVSKGMKKRKVAVEDDNFLDVFKMNLLQEQQLRQDDLR